MANIQKQMLQFHESIKLKRFDENEVLREKRDRILKRLDTGLKELFSHKNMQVPEYEFSDQGSYAMGTGTKPIDGDYDIDVGLWFKISTADYPEPMEVKQWVYDALYGHTKRVEIRRPCVTVYYQQDDEPVYHVDLAVYSDETSNSDGKTYLAKGKLSSSKEYRIWQESNPEELIQLIKNCCQDKDDAKQFRRIIRYLKRWKDVKFSSEGNAAPIGIGITVAAYYWFVPKKSVDAFQNIVKYDDLNALRCFVRSILDHFQHVYSNGELVERLEVLLPVPPSSDLFEKMTDNQMADFKEKLTSLLDAVEEAQQTADPSKACKRLRQQFGDDFPDLKEEETAQKQQRAIISSSSSA
jgi:hypothetical protein